MQGSRRRAQVEGYRVQGEGLRAWVSGLEVYLNQGLGLLPKPEFEVKGTPTS